VYSCRACNLIIDADFNAAVNILHRGVFRPSDHNGSVSSSCDLL
jgi:transposase